MTQDILEQGEYINNQIFLKENAIKTLKGSHISVRSYNYDTTIYSGAAWEDIDSDGQLKEGIIEKLKNEIKELEKEFEEL